MDNSNEANIVVIVLVVLFASLGFLAGHTAGKDDQLNDMREAYKTCLVAHAETNGRSEEACGEAQDKTSTEFLCNTAGNCWAEVK